MWPALARAQGSEVTVVVEGDRPHPEALSPGRGMATSVVERERFEQPGMSVAEALREAPGIAIVELGGLGAPATACLRGATSAQTPVYFGAVRINDEVGGTANLADVPAYFVERAEIYRGHVPVFAEGLGMGGAIRFEPRRASRDEARLGALVGSYGSRSAFGYAAHRDGDRSVLAGVELAAADNDYPFWSVGGTHFVPGDDGVARLRNADATLRNFWLSGSDRVGRARLEVVYSRGEREQGAPKLALVQSEHARVRFDRDLFALSAKIPVEAWSGSLELTSAALRAETRIDDPQTELGMGTPGTATPGERVEQSVLARQTLGGVRLAQQLAFSVERLRRFEVQNTRWAPVLSARRFSLRAGVSLEVPIVGPVSALATLNVTGIGTAANERLELDRYEPSGRAGLLARSGQTELYASAGSYQRPPTLGELYGASLLVRGNDALSVERGDLIELGARHQWLSAGRRRLAWLDAAAFARWSRDLVTYVATAQGYLHPLNRARSRALGGELVLGAAPTAFLDAELSVGVLDPRDVSPDRKTKNDVLPYLSRATVSGLVSFHADVGAAWLDAVRLGVRGVYRSNRYGNPAGDGVIPEQAIFDLEAAGVGLFQVLTARLRVADVLDRARYDVVGFPLPRRSVFLSMEANL